MSNRACWLSIGLLAGFLAYALNWPAWGQEMQQSVYCDTQDEVSAVVQYGVEAIGIINKKLPQACGQYNARVLRGQPVDTVNVNGELWDIVPVLVVGVGGRTVTPIEQWSAFRSPLVAVTWDGRSTDAKTRAWFESLMQPDNPTASCCGEADAVEADVFEQRKGQYVAVVTDGRGIVATGTRILIPNAKIKWDAGNPSGHGIVFIHVTSADDEDDTQPVGTIYVYCYITPAGG